MKAAPAPTRRPAYKVGENRDNMDETNLIFQPKYFFRMTR
jgi:hypothetical protein